ncbi:MAG: hypothetical protein A3F68_04915 [Acidobacteria bacterium RIFCSPLOWO2_12_FULL_54_10]|nr:MAG: hypothetical protein A3F68_04915 [Acidobacteria bacterium RIFCSPLOWO2_12_FULL_54_10]
MSFAATGVKLCPIDSGNPAPENPAQRMSQAERELLLLAHMPQVNLIAQKMQARVRYMVELADLAGYGMIGLLNAIDRFDPSRGVMLKTFAEHKIRGAILDGLRTMDWLSRSARKKERQKLESLNTSSGTAANVSILPSPHFILLGVEFDELERLSLHIGRSRNTKEFDNNPEKFYQDEENRSAVQAALQELPLRHRQVIQMYYGDDRTMKEIAMTLRVHESRISQLRKAALKNLRSILCSDRNSADGMKQSYSGLPVKRRTVSAQSIS